MGQHTTATQDHAKGAAITVERLEEFLDELTLQPVWRPMADRAADYYDGNQLEAEHIRLAEDRGMAPLIRNMVAPAIDGVLGLEAKTRADWMVRGDTDESTEMAEALNARLYDATEQAQTNRHCSDAHAAQAKTGLGWVEVNKNTNPFEYPIRCSYVHRREISWDWHAKRQDLKDARWLMRDRWVDADKLLLAFPGKEQLIEQSLRAWHNWNPYADHNVYDTSLGDGYNDFMFSNMDQLQWLDSNRDMGRLYEVWYRVWEKGMALRTPDGRAVKFDPKNQTHQAGSRMPGARLIQGTFPVMRLSYFLGPHRVADMASPLPHDMFPYIPFWGFREDKTGAPYGLVRRMMSPQDEINARLSKMMWLLSAKRVVMDDDASSMSTDEIADEVQRPDGVILLDPNRKNLNASAFQVEQDFKLAAQQFQVLQSAEEALHSASGISQAMLGQMDSDASGVAISSLIEQSSTSLAELMDNYRYGRQLVGEQMLALIVDSIGEQQEEVMVNVGKPEPTKRVMLNERAVGEDGIARINNDVVRTKMKVTLGDIQSTAGYRNQVFNRLTEITMTLPDDMKAGIMDIVFQMADIPQKDELVKRLQEISGRNVDPESMSEEERAQYEEQKAEQARQKQQEFDHIQAEIDKLKAEARRVNAEADGSKIDDRKTAAETEKLLKEMEALTQQMNDLRDQTVNQENERVDADAAAFEAQQLVEQLEAAESMAGNTPEQTPPAASPVDPSAQADSAGAQPPVPEGA